LKDKRHLIVQSSAAYLLKLHFGITASTFSYYAAQFDSLLIDSSLAKHADSFTKPLHAFEEFLKQLKVFNTLSPSCFPDSILIPKPKIVSRPASEHFHSASREPSAPIH